VTALRATITQHKRTLVVAVSAPSSLTEWALSHPGIPTLAPTFLDGTNNLIQPAYLALAASLARPLAARLDSLLATGPGRPTLSLLFTGHCLGGAVAALLYAQTTSTGAAAGAGRLAQLAPRLRKISAVTFGAPPVGTKALRKRSSHAGVFWAVVAEGDGVCVPERRAPRLLGLGSRQGWLASAGELVLLRQTPGGTVVALGAAKDDLVGLSWARDRRWSMRAYRAMLDALTVRAPS
jgi:hypothetical protein